MCAPASVLEAHLHAAARSIFLNAQGQATVLANLCQGHQLYSNDLTSPAACAAGRAAHAAPEAVASHNPAQPVPQPGAQPGAQASKLRGVAAARLWQPQELETLLSIIRHVGPNNRLPVRQALEALGWASLPDPDGATYLRVKNKLKTMRYRMQHGEDPIPGRPTKQYQNKTTTWTAWIRAAVAMLGDSEFTSQEVRSMLEADPDISPMLDRRPDPYYKTRLRWQSNFCCTFLKVPGIVWTGRKRGLCKLFRYDPTDPTAVPAKRRRQPKKGVPGLPHLGRHEGSKGDFAATAGQPKG